MNMLRFPFAIAIIGMTIPITSQARSGEKLGYIEVLRDDAISSVLNQCSRSTPEKGSSTWIPTIAQIKIMQKALLPVLKSRQPSMDWTNFSADWGRRYIGIVRRGRYYVYGDYSPHGLGSVCDGGPAFFGAEWDVKARKFTHLAFNGSL